MSATEEMDVHADHESGEAGEEEEGEKGPDFEPPQGSVYKVVKRAIGDQVQVGKEAKATFSRAAGIFILYLTACANDFAREGKRTTINVNDVFQALRELDFEEFIEPLKTFLDQHNEVKKVAKESKLPKKGGGGAAAAAKGEEEDAKEAAATSKSKEEEEEAEGQGKVASSEAVAMEQDQSAEGEEEDKREGGAEGEEEGEQEAN